MSTVTFVFLLLMCETYGQRDKVFIPSGKSLPSQASKCKNKTYCEVTPYYPTDIVINALQENPHLRNYENNDEVDILKEDKDVLDEEPLCLSLEQVVFPKSGETKNLEWRYIVNHENFKQSVRIETCLEKGQKCRVIGSFAEGYYTKCKQKFIYRQLMAVSANGSIYQESFRFPASCCCHVEFRADEFLKSINSKA
nr:PREDICTED: protein spaetzle isoform X1 [Megachile rotundata]XP_012144356.1 PREDICTED: protein spaetzle isoform X1 [Megachile rotundata]XP_012144357.1 PREDICTED: protein spaetzle isoform X1 [Megachile rotundata]XP_012144358.1 PREDICTED: protein spaetzle isoform X1 [Megachile rotundata]